jgi:hypothetical protein
MPIIMYAIAGAVLSVPLMAVVFLLGLAIAHAGLWFTKETPVTTPPKPATCVTCRFDKPDRKPDARKEAVQ